LCQFLREDAAATAVEYAVMLALIIGVCFVAIIALGTATAGSFSNSRDSILDAMNL
jgi:pilus assembly protein Flp/PilA